jgi:hypothetical protein
MGELTLSGMVDLAGAFRTGRTYCALRVLGLGVLGGQLALGSSRQQEAGRLTVDFLFVF